MAIHMTTAVQSANNTLESQLPQLPSFNTHPADLEDGGAHSDVGQRAIDIWLQPCLEHTQATSVDEQLMVLQI